ncbi:MAG: aspartate kinase, partial [Patescibacteria group bacterium]|nr:aspartate kinase [Patescibacteria group bacterium]
TLTNTMEVTNNLSKIYTTYASKPKYFFTLTEGVSETTIIASEEVFDEIRKLFTKEIVLSSYKNLSSITIRMPKEVMETPGIFYFFLKSLAWEGINIMEVVSTNLELTLILEDKEVNRAFAILKSLFTH